MSSIEFGALSLQFLFHVVCEREIQVVATKKQMLADSEIEIYAAEAMMKDVTERADRGENILIKAAAFKVFSSEMCGRVVDRVVQVYGGAGYLAEYDAERFYRDARIYRIYEGTTQILQLQIAKHMLREWESLNS